MMPREHGAWAMVCLPFIVGAVAAQDWAHLRTAAGALAALSVFLLRTPLLALCRSDAIGRGVDNTPRYKQYIRQARFSLLVYSAVALASTLYLCWTVPVVPLLLLGGGAVLLSAVILHPRMRIRQRSLWFQLASIPGLTASALLGYLVAAGELHRTAFWIWLLFAVQFSVSVVVVRSQLEALTAARKRPSSRHPLVYRRAAILAEAALWAALAVIALQGHSGVIPVFLAPSAFHWWRLYQLRAAQQHVSMQRLGITELAASVIFSVLLTSWLN
jgi:hypothetical protein